MALQVEDSLYKRVCKSLTERITHRNINLTQLLGKWMQQWLEHVLVGKHDGSLLIQTTINGKFAQNLRHIFALHNIRDCRHLRHCLYVTEIIVWDIHARRELHNIITQEHTCLLRLVLGIVWIVIPEELGISSGCQKLHQMLLASRERIESGNNISTRFGERCLTLVNYIGSRTMNHSSIGNTQRSQSLTIGMIYRSQRSPHSQKTAFLLGQRCSFSDISPESGNNLQLLGS